MQPGATRKVRITGVLSARGYNIESLTVARTLDPTLSRMTIAVDVDAQLRTQVIKQMNKLINVLQAADLTETPSVKREMALLRVPQRALEPRRNLEGIRNLRRSRRRFIHRRLRPRSYRRFGKTGRIHRRHAQLRRHRSHSLRRRGRFARTQETALVAAGTQERTS